MSSMDRIVDDVRASQDAALADPSRRLAVRNRLLAEPRRRRGARSLVPVAIAGGLAAAAALVIAFYPSDGPEPAALTYTANAEPMQPGAFLSAPSERALSLRFSDGSRVTLDERSSGRVDELTARGARVRLEHGTAEVRVRHRETTEWTVVGGPYEVHVIGTAFRVAWDASAQRFEIALHEGRVRVTGPRIGEREIAAGERLEVSPDEPWAQTGPREAGEEQTPEEPRVDAVASAAPNRARSMPETTPVQRVQTPIAPRAPRTAASQERTAAPTTPTTPLETDADRFDAMLATGTLDALEAAATAARGQRDPRATRVYHALRQRFRGSEASADAAFFLARDAQRTGDLVAADRWLRTYIAEAPNGRFDAEARGRNIEVVAELGLADQARQLAASYLARYPSGAHAAYARQIAQPR